MDKTIDPQSLKGVHLVPTTAIAADGSINEAVQAEHIARLSQAGMKIFLPAAASSGFHGLTADEIVQIVSITRSAAGPDAKLFAPVGLQPSFALEVAKRSMEAGADGIMVMPLNHAYLSDRGAERYYRFLLSECPCPVLIYKKDAIPSDDLLLRLAEDPNVIGVKHATNSMDQIEQVISEDENRLAWICGSAERFAPTYMLQGAIGFTSGAGNLVPHLTIKMYQALENGDYETGRKMQKIILPIERYRARENNGHNITVLHQGLQMLGLDFGDPRPPNLQLTPQERKEIEQMLKPIFDEEAKLSG